MDLLHKIKQKWENEGLIVPRGVEAQELDAFERHYSVALPPAMKEYLQVANGNGTIDNDFITFWPLSDVKLVSEELHPDHSDRFDYPNCFVFADYCIWCWAYAIQLTSDPHDNGPVYLVGG